jgi:hypothetical protein
MRWTPLLLAGLLVPALAAADAAPAGAPATTTALPAALDPAAAAPFAPGEELRYDVTILGIQAGEAQFRVEENDDPGTFKFTARGRSLGAADSLFRLRQTATCEVDRGSLALRVCRVATEQRSGNRRREFLVDRAGRRVRERLLQDGKPREKVVDFGEGIDGVQEALSGLYLLRTHLPADGTPLRFQALRKGQPITIEARSGAVSEVDTPAGKFQAVEVKLAVVKGEADEGEAAGSLWFTADARRLPVKLSFDAKVGKLEAQLTDAKGTLALAARTDSTDLAATTGRR